LSTAQPVPIKKTLFTEALIQNPYPIYRQFLEEGPIHYIDRGPAPGLWAVFSYSHCASLLKDARLTAKRSGAMLLAFPPETRAEFAPLSRMLGMWMLFLDAPEHSRLRKLMNKGFAPTVAESLRIKIEAVVDEMLDPVQNASQTEIMQQIAHPLPVRVIAEMLGITGAMQQQLTQWSDAIANFFGNPRRTLEQTSAAQQAVLALADFFRDVVAERRRAKGDDLISLLLEIEADGDVLTEEELYAQCVMLLFGGHETTRNLIGNGILTLLQNPQEASRLRDNPALIRSAVEELLPYQSPVQRPPAS
jgi:cytochrome P450